MKSVLEQLADIAVTYEQSYKGNNSWQSEYGYCAHMLVNNNLVPYGNNGIVLGYFEVWFINFEQFGRLICHAPFNSLTENLKDGNIAYVANTFILPEFRKGLTFKILRNRFYQVSSHCDYYVGVALRKKHSPIKVFKKSELSSKLFNPGDKEGP